MNKLDFESISNAELEHQIHLGTVAQEILRQRIATNIQVAKEVRNMSEGDVKDALSRVTSRQPANFLHTAPSAATSPQASPTKDMHIFKSGGKRSEVCDRYDLIPVSFLERLARRFTGTINPLTGQPEGGAMKYGEGNWERGLPTSDVINHGLKHFTRLSESFRRHLSWVAQHGEGSWEERMNFVRRQVSADLSVDDDLGGAAWALAVLSEHLRTRFHHDERFEGEKHACDSKNVGAGGPAFGAGPHNDRGV